jgi:hypothetical protein
LISSRLISGIRKSAFLPGAAELPDSAADSEELAGHLEDNPELVIPPGQTIALARPYDL